MQGVVAQLFGCAITGGEENWDSKLLETFGFSCLPPLNVTQKCPTWVVLVEATWVCNTGEGGWGWKKRGELLKGC